MATINLGRVKPVFRGAYAGGTAYVVDDIVTSGNETFICIQASTGNATSNASYWTKLAAKGTDGTDGTDVGTTITTQGDILYRDGSGLARLGYGTAGQFLKTGGSGANPSWGDAGGGVLQIKQALINSTNNFASTTYAAIPNFNITITPTAANSSFLIMATIQAGHSNNDAFTGFNFFDSQVGTSASDILFPNGSAVSSRSQTFQTGKWGLNNIGNVNDYINWQTNMNVMYTPSSNNANARTFHIAAFNPQTTVYMNHTGSDGTPGSSTVSSIVVMEIANGIYS